MDTFWVHWHFFGTQATFFIFTGTFPIFKGTLMKTFLGIFSMFTKQHQFSPVLTTRNKISLKDKKKCSFVQRFLHQKFNLSL